MAQLFFDTLARVRTYKILLWNYRDPQLYHPYQLAIQGYECIAYDTIQCHICRNIVKFSQVKANDEEIQADEQQQSSLVDLNDEQIHKNIQNHHKQCIYADLAQKEENYKKQFNASRLYLYMDQISDKIKKSYPHLSDSSQNKSKVDLPQINNKIFWEIVDKKQKKEVMKTVMRRCQMDPDFYQISFVLKLFGWAYHEKTNEENAQNGKQLECLFCGGTTNISDYNTVSTDKQPQIAEDQEENLFDPTQQHRYFCIWNFEVEGWELWLQHLWDKMGEVRELFKRDNPQSVKKIRLTLDKFLETFAVTTKEYFQKTTKTLEQCKKIACNLQGNDEEAVNQSYRKNREQFSDYIDMIESGIRTPLKKMKLQ